MKLIAGDDWVSLFVGCVCGGGRGGRGRGGVELALRFIVVDDRVWYVCVCLGDATTSLLQGVAGCCRVL